MPTNIYLCSAAYQTADGGALASQCPTGTGPDIDTNEFFVIPTVALRDHNGDGKFDRVDPTMDFVLQTIVADSNVFSLTWAAMPGRSYEIVHSAGLAGGWTALPESLTNAGPLQTTLGFSDPRQVTNSQRFYRVKLLP